MWWLSFKGISFTFFLLLTALAVTAAAASLVVQARLSGGAAANWNVFIVVGSYFALGVVSLIIWLSRRANVARRLKTLPKPYVAVKKGDVPKPVSRLVEDEYTRACMVVALSQPITWTREGWGSPGSKHEGVYFRTAILDTVPLVDGFARSLIPKLPPLAPTRPVKYHLQALENILSQHDPSALTDYSDLVDSARFDEQEPTENAWERCQEVVEQMRSIMEFYNPVNRPPERRPSSPVRDRIPPGRLDPETGTATSTY